MRATLVAPQAGAASPSSSAVAVDGTPHLGGTLQLGGVAPEDGAAAEPQALSKDPLSRFLLGSYGAPGAKARVAAAKREALRRALVEEGLDTGVRCGSALAGALGLSRTASRTWAAVGAQQRQACSHQQCPC